MNIYQEILLHILENEKIVISFPELKNSPDRIVESECCLILEEIRRILNDSRRSDAECFSAIEKMISLFEKHGVKEITRHDFG